MTLCDKIPILNSLVGSLLVYHMQLLPSITENDAIKVERLLEDFIWNSRKPKIRSNILYLPKNQGSLKLFDVCKKDKSIKLSWINRLHHMKGTAKALAYFSINPVDFSADFWYYNTHVKDLLAICQPYGYWKDVMRYWCEFNYHEVDSIEMLLQKRKWYNSHIRIDGQTVCYKSIRDKGIILISDLIDPLTSQFYKYERLCEVFDTPINFLQYNSIINAIPKMWKQMIRESTSLDLSYGVDFCIDLLIKINRPTSFVYNQLIVNNESLHQIHQNGISSSP